MGLSTFGYKDRQKKWDAYREFERQYRNDWLKKISSKEAYEIFTELYKFYYKICGKPKFDKTEIGKMRTLAGVHSIYTGVKI
ncbi:MAG: hypothetical protein V1927_06420 [Candidatus Omnitrophota bacterium]